MKVLSILASSILAVSSMNVKAQTADAIIEKHIAAIGGRTVLDSIKSQVIEATTSVMGSEVTSTSTLLVGKGFKNVANFNGQELIQCITTTGGWMTNPLAGQTDPTPLPADELKAAQASLRIASGILDYKDKGGKAELLGKEKIESVEAYKVKLTDGDKKESFYYFDAANYYLIKLEETINANGQYMTITSTFSNYKKTDIGFVVPYTTVRNHGFEMTITVTRMEFNKPVDSKFFEMPK